MLNTILNSIYKGSFTYYVIKFLLIFDTPPPLQSSIIIGQTTPPPPLTKNVEWSFESFFTSFKASAVLCPLALISVDQDVPSCKHAQSHCTSLYLDPFYLIIF